mgnify:CR=1 FL=1
MLTDPIADMLTRIRNATRVYKESTDVPASRFKEEILRILAREGFIKGYERVDVDGKPYLRALTPVPVVMDKCVMCHAHYKNAEKGQAIGAVAYIVPIE